MGKTKSDECFISDDKWVEHFTTLNKHDPMLAHPDDPQVQKVNAFVESTMKSLKLRVSDLDRPFRKEEVLKVINLLKSSNLMESIASITKYSKPLNTSYCLV